MHGIRRFLTIGFALACLLISAGVALSGASCPVGGANSAMAAPKQTTLDPRLHHLSGVVAIPPWQVEGEAAVRALGGDLGHDLKQLLTPPTFGPNVDATLNNPAVQNETTIAINPEDDQRIIASANDYRANLQPWVYSSSDGGTNWTNYQVPGTTSLYYGDPAMAFGTGNKAYFSYLGYQTVCGGGGGMYVSRTTDGGTTFSAPIPFASNHHDTVDYFQDKEYVTVDNVPGSPHNGNVYIGWTTFVSTLGCSAQIEAPIVFTRSTDQGLTWSQPITASQPISNNNQGTVPVVGRHGEVYIYYLGAQTQTQLNYDTVLFSRSTDGGRTFPFFTHIASMTDLPSPLPHTSFRDWGAGAMAADQQLDGYLYAVWADYGTGDADILLSRSTDNGNTWGSPQRLNDDPMRNGKDQFFPWIAASPDGRVHVSWFDRREDPNDANYKEYYTYSTDHGATWQPNIAVSTAASAPANSSFIGDYSGIAATNNVVMPVWTDIRTAGNQNAYVARGQFSSDVTPTPTPQPCEITFTDVNPSDYFYEAVHYLYCAGIISGYQDNTFRPYNNTTRAQITKIVVLAKGWDLDCPDTGHFSDVPTGHPFFCYIETAFEHGIISGYGDGTFRPDNFVTREQLCKIIVLAWGWPIDTTGGPHFSDVPESEPFYGFIETAFNHGVITGYADGTFRPLNRATRSQISVIIYRVITAP